MTIKNAIQIKNATDKIMLSKKINTKQLKKKDAKWFRLVAPF